MANGSRRKPKKTRPDPPDLPDGFDPAPGTLESGAFWDCVEAGADVVVAETVADVKLQESRWVDADLSGRRLTGLHCRDVVFEHCDLSGAVLDDAVLTRVTFTNCRLTGVVLSGAELTDVHISDSRADLANLRMARAKYLLIENTSLHAADFYEFAGTSCGLLGCDLAEAVFEDARLTDTDLHGSTVDDVRGALSLRGSRISSEQILPLGAALLAAVQIQVTNGPAT
ncbi:pentapeptide repeat-containing protein [Pseudonocardia sp. GCM10023141]|uniref:pentapeptide repeat-containing protein n=1 Tax=Pseudonocardia sp. GCM10023141 TaxID=3252653 RepID=UPI00361F5EBA